MPKQPGRVTRRGRIWFGYVYEGGRRKQVNTHCTDRTAALIELRRLEQDAADPRKAAAARTTLRQILETLVEHRWSEAKAGKRAPETAVFYAKKAGVLLRLFGEDFRLAQLDAPRVDAFVRARREEGTSDHTIHKELTTLRASLRLALRARLRAAFPDCIANASDGSVLAGNSRQAGRAGTANLSAAAQIRFDLTVPAENWALGWG